MSYSSSAEPREMVTSMGLGAVAVSLPTAADESVPTEIPAHYCKEHQREFKRYSRGDNVLYSHKTADGK